VGYVDDDAVPGGGYFIVRNSWGDYWAADSPEAPGHALIPYAYVEQFSLEAFTGTAEKRHLKLAGQGVGLGGAWFCPRA
jgi:C1A family cysteine protease